MAVVLALLLRLGCATSALRSRGKHTKRQLNLEFYGRATTAHPE